MRRTNHPRSTRGGFTLVELLVVITIIAVLLALISSAVLSAFGRGRDLLARNDISQIAAGVQAFKSELTAQYVPDRLVLPPGFDPPTQQFLASVWPRLDANMLRQTNGTNYAIASRANDASMAAADKSVTIFEYWQVSGNTPQTLQGDQVLVWLLGGWREVVVGGNTVAAFGFSTDATDPMKPYRAGQQRKGPFYEGFTPERLKVFGGTGRAVGFPSFVDVYERVPYLYFSAGKAANDYTATPHIIPTIDPATDAVTVAQILPYKLSQNKFANASGIQIICAGRDGVFGSGGTNWAGAAGGTLVVGVRDDIANFYQSRLGD